MCRVLSILLLFGSFLLKPGTGMAQQQSMNLKHYGEEQGLNVSGIYQILQDKEGFIWMASSEGLVRFDGHHFRYFQHQPGDSSSISSNRVVCIAEDRDGNIWAGLVRGGVSKYNKQTGKFRNYRVTDRLKIKTSSITSIFFDAENRVWLGISGYGLAELNPETGQIETHDLVTTQSAPHLSPERIPYYNTASRIWQDETGLLWCATSDDLVTFNPKTGQATPHRWNKIAKDGFPQNQAYGILPDGDWLWVGGWGSGLRRYNRKTGEWKQYLMDINPTIPDAVNVVNTIAVKNKDEFWLSSQDKGLLIFNKKTETFRYMGKEYPELEDVAPRNLGQLMSDRNQNVWICMAKRLIRVQMKEIQIAFHKVPAVSPIVFEQSPIYAILEDREDNFRLISPGYAEGVIYEDKKTGAVRRLQLPDRNTFPKEYNFCNQLIQARNGTVWALGGFNVYRLNLKTLQLEIPLQPAFIYDKTGANGCTQFDEDKHGNLWFGTSSHGLFRYDPQTGSTTQFMPDESKPGSLPTHVIGVVHADGAGRIWFGSRDRTAYGYFHEEEHRFYNLDANGNTTNELTSLRLNSYFTDQKGDQWACTEQGLFHYDCSGTRPKLIRKYTIADGLPSDYVAWGVEDRQGILWLASGRYLCRLDVHAANQKVTIYQERDGYPESNGGIGILNDGSVFLRGLYGYYTFQPEMLKPTPQIATLVLTSFRINDQEVGHGSRMGQFRPLVVPDEGRYFSLEFAALDLANPELCRFEYRLDGFDKEWVDAGDRHFANFTNIPAGKYRFKVKLKGRPEEEALVVPLTVQVAFYKTKWFQALFVLLSLGSLLWLYFRRELHRRQMQALQSKAQLLEKEKALMQYETLRQQLNPHFLFNSLTSLNSLITIDPKAAATFLDSLSKTYRYILKSSERDTVPLSEELKFGESFVKLQKTRFGEGLQVQFRVNEDDLHRKIVPVTLQNLIENAIKHNIIDEESPLLIEVFTENGYFVVRNNLQKKNIVETSNQRGLANLASFYKYLSDQEIVVEDDGKHFTIKIPLI